MIIHGINLAIWPIMAKIFFKWLCLQSHDSAKQSFALRRKRRGKGKEYRTLRSRAKKHNGQTENDLFRVWIWHCCKFLGPWLSCIYRLWFRNKSILKSDFFYLEDWYIWENKRTVLCYLRNWRCPTLAYCYSQFRYLVLVVRPSNGWQHSIRSHIKRTGMKGLKITCNSQVLKMRLKCTTNKKKRNFFF